MEKNESLEKALETLKQYIFRLAEEAGEGDVYGEKLWDGIRQSPELLRELAYYHDYGKFLDEYRVEGYTLTDALIWQVDHFKLYMDRPEEMNRYRQQRLLLAAFDTMLRMEREPEIFATKFREETGQDIH